MEKNPNWLKVADRIDEIHFGENNIASMLITGKSICIIKTTTGLKACTSKCPHAGADLCDGYLDNRQNIICPVHGYRFNLSHGRDSNSEGYFLKIFPVKLTEEGIFVSLE